MTYINDQLMRLQEQVIRKKRIQTMLQELRAQEKCLVQKLDELGAIKVAEQADVDRLEGRSLAAFFYGVIGKKDEKLDKERREAYAARVKYDVAAKELEAVQTDIRKLVAEDAELRDCEWEYSKLLRKKRESIRLSGGTDADAVIRLEEKLLRYQKEQKELREAINAGQQALCLTKTVLDKLSDAKGWSKWDLLGGGLLADVAKHEALDEAQGMIEQLQVQLRRFKTELGDVAIREEMQVNLDSFLRFADYFFDGLFVDWTVMDKISQSQSQVDETRSKIERILGRLEYRLKTAEQELTQTQAALEEWVLQAE